MKKHSNTYIALRGFGVSIATYLLFHIGYMFLLFLAGLCIDQPDLPIQVSLTRGYALLSISIFFGLFTLVYWTGVKMVQVGNGLSEDA